MSIHPSTSEKPLIALAGGKSGGHVFPALAVAEELRSLGGDVVYFGLADGMEASLAAERDIEFVAIDAGALVGRGIADKASSLMKLALNAVKARQHLRRRNVVGVLGTGGFVSAPTVLGGRLLGLPIVLLEPNAHPGAANRLLSRFALAAAVAHEMTGRHLHCESQVVGVPTRSEFARIEATADVEAPIALLIVGGSQGAVVLNRELPALVSAAGSKFAVVHQCGAGNVDECVATWRELMPEADVRVEGDQTILVAAERTVRVVAFLAMADALEAADLVISRAGAITLAELSAAGRASILIPLQLADAHQLGNAQRQAELGAAIVVEQSRIRDIEGILRELATDTSQLSAMASAAKSAARPEAARTIAELVVATTSARKGARWAA